MVAAMCLALPADSGLAKPIVGHTSAAALSFVLSSGLYTQSCVASSLLHCDLQLLSSQISCAHPALRQYTCTQVTGPLAANFKWNAFEGQAREQAPAAFEARVARLKATGSALGL